MKKNFYKSALASKNRILKLYTLNSDTSLNRSIQFYQKNLPLFYEWLAGFIDGEGNFQINPLKGKSGEIVKFSFMFNINLHVDDIDVLHRIPMILGIDLLLQILQIQVNTYVQIEVSICNQSCPN